MKVLAHLLTIWVAVLSTLVLQEPSLAQKPPVRPQQLAAPPTFSLDLEAKKPGGYTKFLDSFRAYVAGETVRGILMMAKPGPRAFFTVELKATADMSITLAIDKNDLYVVGYKDKVKVQEREEERAFIFEDHEEAKDLVFQEVTTKIVMSYKSNYDALEDAAKSTRRAIGLGMQKLQNRAEKVYGVAPVVEKSQAEFLLLAIQTIAEAARFKYVEDQIVENFGKFEFTPPYRMYGLVKEWGKISTAIRGLKGQETQFKNPVIIEDWDGPGKPKTITELNQIAPKMALLKYVPVSTLGGLLSSSSPPLSLYFPRILMIFLGIDYAADDQPIHNNNNIPPLLFAA